jgi:uncharacterized protein YycO
LGLRAAAFLAPAAPVFEPPAGAQAGDLIFRQGAETVSQAVMAADGGGYSHVGMLLGGPGRWRVLHATPSEVPGRPDGVVIDSLAFFCAPERSRHQSVYHVQAGEEQRQRAIANAKAQIGRTFNLTNPQAGTYCTQLVWQAWQAAGLDWQAKPSHLHLPFIAGDYWLPSDLRASPRLRQLPEAGR